MNNVRSIDLAGISGKGPRNVLAHLSPTGELAVVKAPVSQYLTGTDDRGIPLEVKGPCLGYMADGTGWRMAWGDGSCEKRWCVVHVRSQRLIHIRACFEDKQYALELMGLVDGERWATLNVLSLTNIQWADKYVQLELLGEVNEAVSELHSLAAAARVEAEEELVEVEEYTWEEEEVEVEEVEGEEEEEYDPLSEYDGVEVTEKGAEVDGTE